jgi:hypothetical protein
MNIFDFRGNEIKKGDKVVAVVGKHLRESIIEDIIQKEGFLTQVKMKGIKTTISVGDGNSSQIIKI